VFVAIAACCVVAAAITVFILSSSPETAEEVAVERPAAAPRAAPRADTARPSSAADSRPRAEEPPEPAAAEPAPPVEAPPPPSAEFGVLRIDADVPGAQVFIDRQFVGAAPVTAENLTPGTHQLNVSAEGFESIAMPIDVTTGARDMVIRFREVRLDSAIDVVHRHGIGSCRGKLIATPSGMRYETSNKGDAFATPLQTLETFQVDYLEKNLRVRLPKGRQFNFTDPDGNADRLFVFHRDVEKARDRLKRGDAPAGN
jgi:hypothetical protein